MRRASSRRRTLALGAVAIVGGRAALALTLGAVLLMGWWVPGARAGSWTALVPSASSVDSLVTPIDLGTNTAGAAVPTTGASSHLGVATSPDGRTAYVVSAGSHALVPVDMTTSPPTPETPVDLTGSPPPAQPRGTIYIAISPDGTKAYVSDSANGQVLPVDLTHSPVTLEPPITVGGNPHGIAFSPQGTKAYVANYNDGTVTPITVATNTPAAPITAVGTHPDQIAITPNGSKAYVTDNGSANVYPIALPSEAVQLPISVGGGRTPLGIAITPDGTMAYTANFGPASNFDGTGSTVTPIALLSGTAGPPITVGGGPWSIAVTPDSKTVYVGNSNDATVTPIDVAAGTAGSPITGVRSPRSITISPDQAPVANFSVTSNPAGGATSFDASSSSVRFGTIARYDWDFGDGATATTTGPTTTHLYADPGSYTATVTETSSGGTSATGQIYTGQTASSVGAPSARASRSVVVAASGQVSQPQVSLSASALDLGTAAVGTKSAARTLRITNSGNAGLSIAASAMDGSAAADYRLSADGCTGTTVGPGASCSVDVTLTPSSEGQRTARLAFTDDASGSPHTVALTGRGTRRGTLLGTVFNGDAGKPLPGAQVRACVPPGFQDCRSAVAGGDGGYAVADLPAGPRSVEVFPPSGSLGGASAQVQIVAGDDRHDFTLVTPKPVAGGVAFQTLSGTASSGVPVVNWNAPFSFEVPVDVPAHADPGSVLVIPTSGTIGLNPGDGGNGGFSLGATTFIGVSYDADGQRVGIAGFDEAPAGAPIARAAKLAGGVTGTNTTAGLLGLIPQVTYDPKNSLVSYLTTTIPFPYSASVKIVLRRTEVYNNLKNRGSSEPDSVKLSLERIEAHQPIGDACDEGFKAFQDAWPSLRDAVIRLYNALFGGGSRRAAAARQAGSTERSFDSVKAAGAAFAAVETAAITAAYAGPGQPGAPSAMGGQVLVGGVSVESAASDTSGVIALHRGADDLPVSVRFTVPSLAQRVHGSFNWSYRTPMVSIGVTSKAPAATRAAFAARFSLRDGESCPMPPRPPPVPAGGGPMIPGGGGGGYVDPSGLIVTKGGAPLAGARVTLLLRASKDAALTAVPDGSAIMSPANRRNPDRSGPTGQFGWDVLPGFYAVTATHAGCRGPHGPAATTPLLTVPPPVTDLRLALSCPHLRRARTSLTARALLRRHGGGALVAQVHTRRSRPAGTITFTSGRRVLGRAVLDPGTATASLATALRTRPPRLTASYSGDGTHGPSRARASG